MNTNRKILIDKYFGRPVVILFNLLARLLGFLLKRNHHLTENTRCICICKFVGMGSIIQSTPLISTLKNNYPASKIVYLTSENNRALIGKIKPIDCAIYIDDSGLWPTLKSTVIAFFQLLKLKPSCFIDLEIYSNFSTIISTLSCANNRLGFFRKDNAILMGIYTHMLSFNINAPIAKVYLQMARLLGCKEITETLYAFETTEVNKNEKLSGIGKKPFIVINPNASDLRIERRWDKINFIKLISSLLNKLPFYNIVLIGSKNEADYVNQIKSEIDDARLLNTCGQLNLDELFSLIKNAALMITNDTGPMHVAFAMKTKTIGLFGPCSPMQYGQFENAWCVYKKLYCSPCVHEFLLPPCGGNNQCMALITVDEVFSLADKVLHNAEIKIDVPSDFNFTSTINQFPFGLVKRTS